MMVLLDDKQCFVAQRLQQSPHHNADNNRKTPIPPYCDCDSVTMNELEVHRNHRHIQWQHYFVSHDCYHLHDHSQHHALQMKATEQMCQCLVVETLFYDIQHGVFQPPVASVVVQVLHQVEQALCKILWQDVNSLTRPVFDHSHSNRPLEEACQQSMAVVWTLQLE